MASRRILQHRQTIAAYRNQENLRDTPRTSCSRRTARTPFADGYADNFRDFWFFVCIGLGFAVQRFGRAETLGSTKKTRAMPTKTYMELTMRLQNVMRNLPQYNWRGKKSPQFGFLTTDTVITACLYESCPWHLGTGTNHPRGQLLR